VEKCVNKKPIKRKVVSRSKRRSSIGSSSDRYHFSSKPPSEEPLAKNAVTVVQMSTTNILARILDDPKVKTSDKRGIGEQLIRFKKSLEELPDGEMRALFFHKLLDEVMAEEDKMAENTNISCRKGCTACCHRLIAVTPDEGALLTRALKNLEGGAISAKTLSILERQSAYSLRNELEFWIKPYGETKCVFLGAKGECQIYSNRPATCRLHKVTSDPYQCSKDATQLGKDETEKIITINGEILLSAMADINQGSVSSIPQAILSQLKKPEKSEQQIVEETQAFVENLQKKQGDDNEYE